MLQIKQYSMAFPQAIPPKVAKKPKTLEAHGDKREDPWFWLQEIENPEVKPYLEAENKYCDSFFTQYKPLQQEIFSEMKQRLAEDDKSVPEKDGDYYYYHRYSKNQQYPIYCRSYGTPNGKEELLLDLNALADGKSFLHIGEYAYSPDHKLLAYSIDEAGDEKYTIHVKDLTTGKLLPDQIANTSDHGLVWTKDVQSFYYVTLDKNQRPKWVKSHRLGTNIQSDITVYEEKDPKYFVSVDLSESGEVVFVQSVGNNASEWFWLDSHSQTAALQLIQKREKNHEYDVSHRGDTFYIRTNWQAEDFRIVQTKQATPGKEHWKDFIAHLPGSFIDEFSMFENYLVCTKKIQGKICLEVMRFSDLNSHLFSFPEEAYELEMVEPTEFSTDLLRFEFSSLRTPECTYDYHMGARELQLKKKTPIPDPQFKEEDYCIKRILAPSHDGAQIPIVLLYHKDTPLDGSAPLFQYGYGSYGLSIPDDFSNYWISLADRGFILAKAHIRGGKEMGWNWYAQGKLLKKKNTFEDFIACTKHMNNIGYTRKGNCIIFGGSAGGLLMGAVINEAPELYKAAIAAVPFVDTLTTMLDDSLPLTTAEYNEWGNPQEKEYYDYIKSYSPMDNIKHQPYPHLFVLTGLHDTRVTYWEPAKWVAKLREYNTSKNLILLRTYMDSGHSGASGRYEELDERAWIVTFTLLVQ